MNLLKDGWTPVAGSESPEVWNGRTQRTSFTEEYRRQAVELVVSSRRSKGLWKEFGAPRWGRQVSAAAGIIRPVCLTSVLRCSYRRRHQCIHEPQGRLLRHTPMEGRLHTLKTEFVHRRDYNTRAEAHCNICAFIKGVYKRTRLHSAGGYIAPIEMKLKAA